MTLKKITAMAMAGLLSVGIVATTVAQDAVVELDPAAAITAREGLMKAMGGGMRGAGDKTGQDAIDLANVYVNAFAALPTMFPEGSIEGTDALPAILENREAFDAILVKGQDQAALILAAAEAGDTVAFADAIKGLGPLCGECHQTFRAQ